jgi:hypothetical protein
MTKIIGILIIAVVVWGGYELFEMWDRYDKEQDVKAKEAAHPFSPQSLAGMPPGLEPSYATAEKNGAAGVRNWLKINGARVEDPRRAWIELDYVVLVAHDDPVEAKKVFADVKGRTPETSPVYKRIKELQNTYE